MQVFFKNFTFLKIPLAKVKTFSIFNRVVLVEFPRKGIYAMGFVTSETKGEVQALIKADVVSVFVPTTPNPKIDQSTLLLTISTTWRYADPGFLSSGS